MNLILVINFLILFCFTFQVVLSNEVILSDTSNNEKREQLKLVNVIFRHGDRAPDTAEMFPKDPNYNNTFFPEGPGGLTNQGKLREYKLGEMLRKKYDDFLGDIYLPNSVYARSTDYARTKMCLQLVLAALYPPQKMQIWNQQLLWQPIPMNYDPWQLDWLMFPEECPEYLQERKKALEMPELKSKVESFKSFMKNLTDLTGKRISVPYDMYKLYLLFVAESKMNLTLPNWTKDIFPFGKLLDGILLELEIFSFTKNMQRLNGGKLLYYIIEEMKKVMNGSADKNRKINLFSGHGTNIVAILQTLGIFKPHVPEYSSAVILEFLQLNNEYYVKILYYKGITKITETMKISGCDFLCPFNEFLDILKDVIPAVDELGCNKI